MYDSSITSSLFGKMYFNEKNSTYYKYLIFDPSFTSRG